MNRRHFIALAAFLATGCAATGALYQPVEETKPGYGIIYVYRPLGGKQGENPYVQVGTGLPRQLRAGAYTWFEVEAGTWQVRAFQNMLVVPTIPHITSVEVADGGVSFVRVDQRLTKLGSGGEGGGLKAMQTVEIEEVDQVTGSAEISETRLNY